MTTPQQAEEPDFAGSPLPPGHSVAYNGTGVPERVVHFDAIAVDIPSAPLLETVRRAAADIGKLLQGMVEAIQKTASTMHRFGLVDLRPARQRYSAPRPLRSGGGAEYTRRRRRR